MKAQAKTRFGDIIEVGMTVVPCSEYDASRPGRHRLKVKEVLSNTSVILENGSEYHPGFLYYPAKAKTNIN